MTEARRSKLSHFAFRLSQLGPVRSARRWYKHKSASDQRAINLLLVFVLALGLYFVVWEPSRKALAEAQSYYNTRLELYQWVKGNEAEIRELLGQRGTSSQEALGGRSLLTIVTDSAKKQGIELKRFEPKGESAVNLWLEGAQFNEMVVWLDGLREQFEVRVDQVSIDRDPEEPGLVTVKLQLSV